MSEIDKVQDIYFGPAPINIPAGTKIRRWDTALGGGLLVATIFSFLLLLVIWRPLPLLGDIDPSPLKTHFRYWLEILINLASNRFFASESRQYFEYVNQQPFEVIYGRLGIVAATFTATFIWATKAFLTPRDQIIHVGGAQLKSGVDAQRAAKQKSKNAKPFMNVHPSLSLPKTKWTRHLLIYGSVGSGKTQILIPIIQQIVAKDFKAILYDVKGDITSYLNALLISPWDTRSAIWDIAKDICTRDAAQEFAASMVPNEGKDPFWSNAAQFLLTGILLSLQAEKGLKWGWKELSERCNFNQEKLLALMTKYYPKGANVIADPTSTQTNSVISTLAAYTRLIDDLAFAWGDTTGRELFSLREWIRDDYAGKRQIILQAGKGEKLTSAYIAAMINAVTPEIISGLPDDEQGRTLFFVLDEFTSLSKIKIPTLIDKGRSKGVCVILGFQDIAQVRKVYGADDAKSITSMVGTHIVCQVGPGETREFVANQIVGKRRIATLNTNVSMSAGGVARSTAYNEEDRAILIPSQLTSELGPRSSDSPAGFSIRSLYISGSDMLMFDWAGVDTKKLIKRASFEMAQWVMPNQLIQEQLKASTDDADTSLEADVDKRKVQEVTMVELENAVTTEDKADENNPMAEIFTEVIADELGIGDHAIASAVIDALTSDPAKPKPKAKVFVNTITR
jgi:type IV secretory pathway TraG/TraD family ATPase VirD4